MGPRTAEAKVRRPEKATVPDPARMPPREVETLFREHNEALVRFLRARLNSDADAREAAQEAYVRLLKLDQTNQPSFLRAYLFRIAANVATDMLRQRRSRGTVIIADTAADQPEPASQEQGLAARQELEIIDQALQALPARCREAFLLSRREGLSTAQIAADLNVSDRMVRLYLVRAIEHTQLALSRSSREGRRI